MIIIKLNTFNIVKMVLKHEKNNLDGMCYL